MKNKNELSSKNNNYKPFKEIPIKIINAKYYKNELQIEDILKSDICISDLLINKKSRFLKILTLDNIKKLINFCLQSDAIKDKNSPTKLRYPYYSCELLCSSCVLFFENSIKNIKKYNDLKNENENEKKK